ncbi:Myb/SANT-like DNA-binding domain [Popillia japonica]|uniref:Regulatory protein zeste n=1 Tax=Popillia japonica TaxID=7064 RepID=A0AAW1MB44_POPJA
MSDKIKKSRSAHFSKEEELLFADEVYKERNIIECKMSNKVSNLEKDQAWDRVLNSFNSRGLACRSIDQLKAKYDNLKSKARKVVANKNKCIEGTGGGPSYDSFDPIIEAILKIINMKTVVGLQCPFDSDCYSENSTTNIPASPNSTIDSEPIPIIILQESTVDVAETTENANFQRSLNVGWNKYIPKKLKEPVSRKLRPTVPTPLCQIKEDY